MSQNRHRAIPGLKSWQALQDRIWNDIRAWVYVNYSSGFGQTSIFKVPSGMFVLISTVIGFIGNLANALAIDLADGEAGSCVENFVPKPAGGVAFMPSSVKTLKFSPKRFPIWSAKILASVSYPSTVICTSHFSRINRHSRKSRRMASFCSGGILLGCICASSATLFDSTIAARSFAWPASNFAAAASFPACSALSFKEAISKPEMTLIPRAATTSKTMPVIKMRQPRSTSRFCFLTMSSNKSGLNSSGGSNLSALFSTLSPHQTIMPPDTDRNISSQNQGDANNFRTKFIFALMLSIPQLIILGTLCALLFHRRRSCPHES